MPRRAEIQPRTVVADPVYGSVLVTQLVNRLMADGKKSIAERVVYDALTQVADKTGKPAIEALDAAVKSVTPVLEVRSRGGRGGHHTGARGGGPRPGGARAGRYLVTYARERREKGMEAKLAGELMDAIDQQGGAFKRKDDMYRMAQANKAFAHYRW